MKKMIIMLLLSALMLDTYAATGFQQDTTRKKNKKTMPVKKRNQRDTMRRDTGKRDTMRPPSTTPPQR